MTEAMHSQGEPSLERIAAALNNGLVVLDRNGEVAFADKGARRLLNGGLSSLASPTGGAGDGHDNGNGDGHGGVDCVMAAVEIPVDGGVKSICVVRQLAEARDSGFDLVAAVESVMSDTSWFTRTVVEKLKAWRQAKTPAARSGDLEQLTDREREILALICEGRSDAEMSALLHLSQNTVRNHVASLYRKIGVNRRSAAVIWARERAITAAEVMALRKRNRAPRERKPD